MTWPAAQVKTNFDQSSDDPKVARSDLAGNVDKFNQMQAHVSSYIQGLLDDADAAAARTTLGLVIGTDVQALDDTLTSLAAVAGVSGDILYASGTDTWARLAKGSDTEVLTLASGIPSWAASDSITRYSKISMSGSSGEITSFPAGTNRIIVSFLNVSLSGSDRILIRLGDAGGYETSGYISTSTRGSESTQFTDGFGVTQTTNSSNSFSGVLVFVRHDGNVWTMGGNFTAGATVSTDVQISAGRKTLSAEITKMQFLTTGANSFDAGEINLTTE